MTEGASAPKGVVLLLIDPKGRVVAEVTDFDEASYGGYTRLEAQRLRCKRALGRETLERLASPIVAKAFEQHHVETFVQNLVLKHGYRTHETLVGHEKE